MTVSGTVSTTTFNTNRVIDHAFRRCRLPPQAITSEMQTVAQDILYLMLSDFANRGIQLWTIEKLILPMQYGVMRVPMPAGTIDVMNTNLRTLQRLSGQVSDSQGLVNTDKYAFDGDLTTSLQQTVPNGWIQIDFLSGTRVTNVGVNMFVGGTYNIVFEVSNDGVNWVTALAPGVTTYTAGIWQWYDIEGAQTAEFIRMRETGGSILNVAEFYAGAQPSEIPFARLNQDDYTNLPNKQFLGRPLQFWYDRQRDTHYLTLWPTPDANAVFNQIVTWRRRYIMDVGTLTQSLDIPQRWYEGIVACLAWRLAIETPAVDPSMVNILKPLADEAVMIMQDEERDNSPMKIAPNISVYTR